MASEQHLQIIRQGVDVWNEWRKENSQIRPDLADADLHGANLTGANFHGAILSGAYLTEARLDGADLEDANLESANLHGTSVQKARLRGAQLSKANLWEAVLNDSDLQGANLSDTNLREADFYRTNLSEARLSRAGLLDANLPGADLRGASLFGTHLAGADLSDAKCQNANFERAILIGTNLSGAKCQNANFERAVLIDACLDRADLTGASIYGISVWDVSIEGTTQLNLVVHHTREVYWNAGRPQYYPASAEKPAESVITVDNIEVAQFIYLLLNKQAIRQVIDTITCKAVLILGRFSNDRKPVLDALRNALRNRGFLPIVFDFERPKSRDFTETIMTLAGMSCFVIADITNPKSAPLELQATVPNYMIPFVPILQDGEPAFSMFLNLQTKYHWVFDVLGYDSSDTLIEVLDEAVINPALEMRDKLEKEKILKRPTRHVDDYRKRPRPESTR